MSKGRLLKTKIEGWHVYLSIDGRGSGDWMDDGGTWAESETPWGGVLKRWSWPSNPDGLIVVNERAHIWDAKYRRLANGRYASGYVYQAHAFRDSMYRNEKPIGWSVVIHPGLGVLNGDGKPTVPLGWKEGKGSKRSERPGEMGGGVGLVRLAPGQGEAPDLNAFLDELEGFHG